MPCGTDRRRRSPPHQKFQASFEEGWIRVVSCCSPAPLNEACRLRQSRISRLTSVRAQQTAPPSVLQRPRPGGRFCHGSGAGFGGFGGAGGHLIHIAMAGDSARGAALTGWGHEAPTWPAGRAPGGIVPGHVPGTSPHHRRRRCLRRCPCLRRRRRRYRRRLRRRPGCGFLRPGLPEGGAGPCVCLELAAEPAAGGAPRLRSPGQAVAQRSPRRRS
ncbi:hypothetical protein SRABI128_06566 [Microbacterium sp. Bi128]|nr:hypothetical protein SRABI128_06566 [Microbacterium sp. Bi128]